MAKINEPPIVHNLRNLPEVGDVRTVGSTSTGLTIIHIRDWHFVPEDLAQHDGIDFEGNNATVASFSVAILLASPFRRGIFHLRSGAWAAYVEGRTPVVFLSSIRPHEGQGPLSPGAGTVRSALLSSG